MARKQRKPVNTDKQVAALKPEPAKFAVRVKDMTGLYLRVTPQGFKSYAAAVMDPHGKQVWATLGGADVLSVDAARDMAREVKARIKAGELPFPPPPVKPDSFEAVAADYMKRHVKQTGLRTEGEIQRVINKYILPKWRDRDFLSIKKSDVTALLDYVQDNHGARQADAVLSIVRQIMRWYANRSDDYVCVVDGRMRRTDPKERRRKRIFNDDEIRLLWAAADRVVPYGDLARLALLTGQRMRTIARMRWEDVPDGVWSIPVEDRQKGHGEILPLPDLAAQVLARQPRVAGNPYVFAGIKVGKPFNNFPRSKPRLDAAIAEVNGGEPIPPWVFHDLRRSARSLLARAGVQQEIAERVLGHTQDAIVETYDLHDYERERGVALQKLAAQIELVLSPPADNVRPIRGAAE